MKEFIKTESISSLSTLTDTTDNGEFSILEASQTLFKSSILLTKTVMKNMTLIYEIKEIMNSNDLNLKDLSLSLSILRPLQFEYKFLSESVKRNVGSIHSEGSIDSLDPRQVQDLQIFYTNLKSRLNDSGLLETPLYDSILDFPELDTLQVVRAASISSLRNHVLSKVQEAEWKRVQLLDVFNNSLSCKIRELEEYKGQLQDVSKQLREWYIHSQEQLQVLRPRNSRLKQVLTSSSHLLQKANGITIENIFSSDDEEEVYHTKNRNPHHSRIESEEEERLYSFLNQKHQKQEEYEEEAYFTAIEDFSDLCIHDSIDLHSSSHTISYLNDSTPTKHVKRRQSMPFKNTVKKVIKRKGIKCNFKKVLYTSE